MVRVERWKVVMGPQLEGEDEAANAAEVEQKVNLRRFGLETSDAPDNMRTLEDSDVSRRDSSANAIPYSVLGLVLLGILGQRRCANRANFLHRWTSLRGLLTRTL
jgi:hypothetical protein